MKEIMVMTGNEKEKGKAGSVKDEIGTVAGGGVIQGAEVGVGIVKDMPTAVVLKGAEMEQKSRRRRRRRKRRKGKMMVRTTLIRRLLKLISSEQLLG
jgi:hypothetical protein